MPSIINASSSGSGGLVQTADASGVLQLQSNGTVALSTSGANVVLGGQISVVGGDGSIQRNGGNTWIMLSSNTGYNSNGVHLKLDSSTSAGSFNFFSVGTQILGMAGTGKTLVLQGGTDSAGTGIAFPATQSASGDANTLDDYEEGTFTATVSPSSSGSVTLDGDNTLVYTKVGRIVTVSGRLDVQSVSSPTGELRVSLPFTVANLGQQASTSCSVFMWNAGGGATEAGLWVSWLEANQTFAYFRYGNSAAPSGNAAQYMQSGVEIRFNVTYVAA